MATDYHQMMKWALSFALSGEESQSVRSLSNTEQVSHHTRHREEAEGRIKTAQADHQSLRDTIVVCVDPLDCASHPDGALMNIVTGQIAPLMSVQIMPSALETSSLCGRTRSIALSAS